jgi:ribosomal protein S18 acetylase RimI-like enzyme
MLKIRNYKPPDYLQVVSILKEANLFDEIWDSEENLLGMVSKDPESVIVAEIDDSIVGNLFMIPYGDKIAYLFRLAVKQKYRKQGIATELIKYAQKLVKSKGVSEVGLYVDSNNKTLQSFYQKRGFKASNSTYYYMWNELK